MRLRRSSRSFARNNCAAQVRAARLYIRLVSIVGYGIVTEVVLEGELSTPDESTLVT